MYQSVRKRFWFFKPLIIGIPLLLLSQIALSTDANIAQIQLHADTLWIVIAGILVFFMQAGFGLLESGMSRSKNSVNVILKNYMDICVGSLVFFVLGFGLMFGKNESGFMGTDHFLFESENISDYAFIFFQTMFAATAVTITSGAMAERTRFIGYLITALVICAVIYPIYGSWVWGGFYEGQGWLAKMSFIDFAGSTVVHSVGGWCALAGILVLGPRLGRFKSNGQPSIIPAHNMNYVALGGFILWFGWFGFNAGSTVSADVSIGLIAFNTQLSAAAGATGVLLFSLLTNKKILASSTINGSLAGLVGITAGCATMTPIFAILTGFIASGVYILSERLLLKLKIDDVVGAVSVHGFCGAWGTLAAGIFYSEDLFNIDIIAVQLIGIVSAFLWVFPIMYLVYYLVNITIGLRVDKDQERRGLDFSEHDEQAYPEFQKSKLFNNQ